MMMENKNVRPWQQYQALYLHIPFCVQKCLYCDFASYAGFGEQAKRDYTDAVCKEIALRADEAANMAANASITMTSRARAARVKAVVRRDCSGLA